MPTAILVDGGFFIKSYQRIYKSRDLDPKKVAENLYKNLLSHLQGKHKTSNTHQNLYRIFYYDCPPLTKKAHNPITNKAIDFSKTQQAQFRFALHDELKRRRKVALRLGYLDENHVQWQIRPQTVKALLRGKIAIADLEEEDAYYDTRQKGVDMRIGVDIASMAFKRQVDQMVLVAGDSDFVPAAKLARREGIDFILDPMWNPIKPDLYEHIDGLFSPWPKPK